MTGNALFGLLPTLSSLFGGGGGVLFSFFCLFLKVIFLLWWSNFDGPVCFILMGSCFVVMYWLHGTLSVALKQGLMSFFCPPAAVPSFCMLFGWSEMFPGSLMASTFVCFSDCLWLGLSLLLWERVQESFWKVQNMQADTESGENIF